MDNNSISQSPDPDSTARRRSGRVVKAPSKFVPEASQSNAAKRKRTNADDEDDEEGDDVPELDEEMSDEEEQDSDADATPPPTKRKASQTKRAKKPAAKKPKPNGTQSGPSKHTATIARRPKKTAAVKTRGDGAGLYADIFASGDSAQTVAQVWLQKYRADDAQALLDVVNCVLQSIGCEQDVTIDDIRDQDNIPNRLEDLHESYQEQQETEYPLISRAKNSRSFRDLLHNFFFQLVQVLHESEDLYKDKAFMDNLQAWLASMSSSALRPFRHTATTISLSIMSSLVEVAKTLDKRITNGGALVQQSKSSKNKNKQAAASLQASNDNRAVCGEVIQSYFDTVFVHRYRDYDPKIRAECVEALGQWIHELPTVFMEPGYLRYLGWMLSDTNAITRQEVLKQLLRIFKSETAQLGHFIDRFRPRLIEMATKDAEVAVRVTAISVADTLRAAALLEPTEIDAIGELIFDSEIRIRRAVVGFFVACVEDVHEGKVDAIGGADALQELPDVDDDDYDSPQQDWIDIKCLAETLAGYDAQIEERQESGGVTRSDVTLDLLGIAHPDTRISLAAQVLYDKEEVVKRWRFLAGYLLFDHTTSTKSKSRSKGKTAENSFKRAVAPTPAEENILLKVLASAVKTNLAQTIEMEHGKRKGGKSEAAEAQELLATDLATVIPGLLNKFGAESETATAVLRLEHLLNLDIFTHLGQSQYETLLDEICTQFNRHDDNIVIAEAAASLLHARQFEELEELADLKLATLWENTINALRNFDKTAELSVRGNMTEDSLRSLSAALMKISKLAGISDCVDVLDVEGTGESTSPSIDILCNIVHRGRYEPQEDEVDNLEDEVVTYAIIACQFYFMWRTRSLAKLVTDGVTIPEADIDRISLLRQNYRRYLIETFSSRAAIDDLRLFATGSLCDLHVAFASTLRQPLKSTPAPSSSLKALTAEMEPGLLPELLEIFDGTEKVYAKKTKRYKTLNPPGDEEDPVEEEEEVDDNDDGSLSREEKLASELKAEKALCELTGKLVLAITAKVLDARGPETGKLRRRLQRNQAKLGNNFKEILTYLDVNKSLRKKAASKKPIAEKQVLSKETIEDDDDDVFAEDERDRRDEHELEDDPIVDDEEGEEDDDEPQRNDRDESILGD